MEWKKGNKILIVFFSIYLAALTWVVLFKLSAPENIYALTRERVLNLIPFYDIIAGKYFDKFDMVANIFAFIPFGIYTGIMLRGIKLRHQVIPAFTLSLAYESVQYIFAIGVADITDVMMNTLGAFCGLIIYRIIFNKLRNELAARRFVTLCSAVSILPMFTVLVTASHFYMV
ncbi:hypothetical protein IMSAG049_00895 [Clostridiales bacterium]|nr:hypothetical protein IMSAG049_00895 [Clostridiales bacterium]